MALHVVDIVFVVVLCRQKKRTDVLLVIVPAAVHTNENK